MTAAAPLYECSLCGAAVKVTPRGIGEEPDKKFTCGHEGAVIWANRKVVLRGKGKAGASIGHVVRLTLRQLLCALTGRSI